MRWTHFLLVLGLAFSLAACGDDKATDESNDTDTATAPTPADEGPVDDDSAEPTPGPAEAESTGEPEVAEIGKPVKAFTITDLDGKTFDLSKPGYTRADAEAAVAAASKEHELGSEDFANAAGKMFGLQASEEAAATLTTKEAAVDWIMKGKDQPLVFMIWSPKCPTSKTYNDRIHEMAQKTGVRLFAVDGNHKDEPKHIEKFAENLGFPVRVFQDKSLVSVDILGGERTPHFMLIDTKGILRYRGGFDNDPQELMEGDQREDWLLDAIAAVQAGKDVEKGETKPFG